VCNYQERPHLDVGGVFRDSMWALIPMEGDPAHFGKVNAGILLDLCDAFFQVSNPFLILIFFPALLVDAEPGKGDTTENDSQAAVLHESFGDGIDIPLMDSVLVQEKQKVADEPEKYEYPGPGEQLGNRAHNTLLFGKGFMKDQESRYLKF